MIKGFVGIVGRLFVHGDRTDSLNSIFCGNSIRGAGRMFESLDANEYRTSLKTRETVDCINRSRGSKKYCIFKIVIFLSYIRLI